MYFRNGTYLSFSVEHLTCISELKIPNMNFPGFKICPTNAFKLGLFRLKFWITNTLDCGPTALVQPVGKDSSSCYGL